MNKLFKFTEVQAHNRIRAGLLASLLTLVLVVSLMGGLTIAQAQGPSLFQAVNDADEAYDRPVSVMRSRLVSVDTGQLFMADGKPLARNAQVTLNIFDDVAYKGVITRVQKNGVHGYSWTGRLAGVENGYFYLITYDDAFIAHIASKAGVYEVSWAGDGIYRVIQLDHSKLVDDYPAEYADPGPLLDPNAVDAKTADSGSQIDIMVVYTDDARAAEGSTNAMKARIALAVAETNTSYAWAGVTPRLRLVHVEEMAYAETGNLSTDLTRFRGTSDGYFDSVHGLRNTYGADMVGLIVENGGAYCGLASAIMATATTAFQVTARSCATGYYSFGHEFGHLQGARHDMYVDNTLTPYSYGHGYTYKWDEWRTVMAYNNACSDYGYNCTRLQYWSNPSNTYGGIAMGDSYSQNYQVLNTTAYTVANWRTAKISQNFNTSFNGSSAGWAPVYGSWSIYSSAYYRTLGVSGMGSSIRTTGNFGDVIFEARMKRLGSEPGNPNRLIVRGNYASLDPTKHWKPSYIFQYTNSGLFSVFEISSTGTATALKTWTTSSAILPNNWNTLKVTAVGSTLRFYINGTLVWAGTDTTLKTGKLGIGMYRGSGTTGNVFYVDWAKGTTNATADLNPNLDEQVADGVEVPGGDLDNAPSK